MPHSAAALPQSVDPSPLLAKMVDGSDKFHHLPSRRATVGGRSAISVAAAVQSVCGADVAAFNARVAAEIDSEIVRFESVHPYIYQMYGILEAMSPAVENRQEMFALVTKIEDTFVNSEEWTMSRGAQSLRVGVVGALESCKTSLVHYFLTGNVGAPSSSEGGRFKKCVYVDGRPFLAHIRDEGAATPEYQFTHWIDGVILVFSVASRSSYSTALHYFRQMTNYRGISDVPVILVGTLNQPLLDDDDSGGEEERSLVREVSTEEARSASVTLKMYDYVECLTYADEIHAVFQSVFRQILHRQRLAAHNGSSVGQSSSCAGGHRNTNSNISQRYSLHGGLGSGGSRLQELHHHHHQTVGPPTSSRKSVGAASYHHQRSISAVPLPPNASSGGNGRVVPLPPVHYHGSSNGHHRQATSPQQLSPSSGPTPRNAGRSALKRQNFSYCPSRYTAASSSSSGYYANPTDNSPNASIRSVYSGSLASVPSAFNSECGASELPRSDSFVEPAKQPQFRRDLNAFGRTSERSSCSSFIMPSSSSSTAHQHLHHHQHQQPHLIMHANERVSTPEIGRLGSFFDSVGPATVLGISPAYSHSSLTSQFSHPTAVGTEVDGPPPYSRSSSSVVENFRADGVPPLLPPPPPATSLQQRNGAFPFYDDSASMSSLYGGGGVTSLANSLSVDGPNGGYSPIVTPNTQRKNRRISSIFRAKDHHHSNGHTPDSGNGVGLTAGSPSVSSLSKSHDVNGGVGVGRQIPVREGYLYKKSNKALNREWKKKYVCLYADGIIKYYNSNKDYRNEAKGKSLYVGLATVRLRRPRAAMRNSLLPQPSIASAAPLSTAGSLREVDQPLMKMATSENGGASTPGEGGTSGNSDGGLANDLQRASLGSSVIVAGRLRHQDLGHQSNNNRKPPADLSPNKKPKMPITNTTAAVAAVAGKKKHKRPGGGAKNNEDDEDCEFEIIASDQTHWEFAAPIVEERVEWVRQIEELIEKCLQSQTSQKQQLNAGAHGKKADVAALRQLLGNDVCADCTQPRPDWASLNLGTLICIECSGIHRNLGSHISRVRSLDLDDWPNEFLCVMQAIGNRKANSVWEHGASLSEKPTPSSVREVKEAWIKRKYEQKAFLAPLRTDCPPGVQLGQCVLKAVLARDVEALMRILPRATDEDVNATVGASGVDGGVGKIGGLTTSGYENNGGVETRRPSTDRRTAVHLACSYDAADILQLLIWYNADVRALDESGKSALWYARLASSNNCRSILLNAGLEPDYGLTNESLQAGGARPNAKNAKRDAPVTTGSEFNAGEAQSRMARLSAEAAEAARHLRHHSGGVVTLRKAYDSGGGELPATAIFEPAGTTRATEMKESVVSML